MVTFHTPALKVPQETPRFFETARIIATFTTFTLTPTRHNHDRVFDRDLALLARVPPGYESTFTLGV